MRSVKRIACETISGRTEALVEEHREQQQNLRATLMTAQKLADEIRLTAEQESQRIIEEAQAKAADLVQGRRRASRPWNARSLPCAPGASRRPPTWRPPSPRYRPPSKQSGWDLTNSRCTFSASA